jgi:two-component system cell cycle response regulator
MQAKVYSMLENSSLNTPVKPRVLIADDSRIVRATLIKHIEGMFEFREALDGEQAWETLLIDPNIRVVITDLTMPKLDGYGLLKRIRQSKISRIRNLPVVIVSGSDEQEERERAKAAGASDLITKGIGTAQLLSRLDILSKLINTQQEFEHRLDVLVRNLETESNLSLTSIEAFEAQAKILLENAVRHRKNFVILNICVALTNTIVEGPVALPRFTLVSAIGQLLKCTVRQSDIVAKTGEAEFTLATGSIQSDSARSFAQRICAAIASVNMVKDERMELVASCGLTSLSEYVSDMDSSMLAVSVLRKIAHRRALVGLQHAVSGVVGADEESSVNRGA